MNRNNPGRGWYRATIQAVLNLVRSLDQRNVAVLKLLPPSYKRAIVRRFFEVMPPATPDRSIEVRGLRIAYPGTDLTRQQYLAVQQPLMRYLASALQPGMTFVDIGANLGFYSLVGANLVGPQGHVHSIEPSRDTLKLLYDNIQRNGLANITVYPCAVGAEQLEQTFFVRRYMQTNSLFAQHIDSRYQENLPVIASYPVMVQPLDNLVQGPVDVIKIDVEGGELEVLAGMARILAENPKLCIVTEWNPVLQEKTGHPPAQLPETLISQGFAVSVISPFIQPLTSSADLRAVLARMDQQKSYLVDIAAVRG